MDPQLQIIQLLRKELVNARARNPAYSMRSLAKRLKISPAAISEIMNGRRPITKNTAKRLLLALCVAPEYANQILSRLPLRHTKKNGSLSETADPTPFVEVDMSQFNLIANWYYFGILSLAETKHFKSDPGWIARRLGIHIGEAEKAIQTLLALDLLKQTASGKWVPTGKQFTTSTDTIEPSIKSSHLQHLDILRESLMSDPVEVRDFSSVTMTFDPSQMKKMKSMIQNFRRKFTGEAEKTKKTEVYRLSIQFVPLSRGAKDA